MLAGKRSEANPLTVMKIGNAIVRSRLDYGATVYGSAAETNLRKIQVVQNAAIRAAMGYLKTTPVHVMISETGQVSMAVRRKALTKREMIKSVFHQDPLARFIQKTLDTDESNGSFLSTTAWENADIVAQTYPKDKSMAELLRRRRFGGIDLHQVIKAKLEGMDQRKEDMAAEQWRAVVAELTNNKYREYTKIYTDGSKIAEGTALAFYDERKDLSQGGKVNNNTTITNAELMAIKEAVDWSSKQKYDKTLILTDSASGCAILRNTKKIVNNSVASEIYKVLTKEEHKHTRIQWIPSHQGIKGNEKADEKAKECASGPQNIFNTLTMDDAIKVAENESWDEWEREFEKTSEEKGKWYKHIQQKPRKKIWFKNLILTVKEIRTLNRIRSGHMLTKDRRASWRWEESGLCEVCEETENIEHILYVCLRFNNLRSKFDALEYCKPLKEIFEQECDMSMLQIAQFLEEAKIQI